MPVSRYLNHLKGKWPFRLELTTLSLIALLAMCIWFFVELADEVIEGEIDVVDRAVVLALRSAKDPTDPLGPRWLEELGRNFTALGSVAVLGYLTLAATGHFLLQRRRAAAVLLLAAVGGGQLLSWLLKDLFDRARPKEMFHQVYVQTASFPSGHATMAVVTYLTLGALLAAGQRTVPHKAYLLAVAIVLALIVGVSRVYLGVHWPTDVLAGWALGGSWTVFCWLAARRLRGSPA